MTVIDAGHDGHSSHGSEAPSYDDLNTPVIVFAGVISAIVTLLTIMFVQGMYYHWQNSYLKVRSAEVVSLPANDQIAVQKAVLDGGDGVLPIDAAMQTVIKRYGK